MHWARQSPLPPLFSAPEDVLLVVVEEHLLLFAAACSLRGINFPARPGLSVSSSLVSNNLPAAALLPAGSSVLYVRTYITDRILFSLGIPRWERTPDRSTHAVTLGQHRWCRRAVTSRALHRTVPSTRPAGAVSRKGARRREKGASPHPRHSCCPVAAVLRWPPALNPIFHSWLVIRYARPRLTLS